MTPSDLVRWGGLSGVLAGVMYALTAVLSLLAPQERVFDTFNDYLIEVIFVLGLAGTLVAIVGPCGPANAEARPVSTLAVLGQEEVIPFAVEDAPWPEGLSVGDPATVSALRLRLAAC